jgi:Derlin-2/3
MPQSLEEWYRSTPVVTRTYLTLAFLITAACALDVRARTITLTDVESGRKHTTEACVTSQLISPFTVYFNSRLIYSKLQLWRLFTNFLNLGAVGVSREACPEGPLTCVVLRTHRS